MIQKTPFSIYGSFDDYSHVHESGNELKKCFRINHQIETEKNVGSIIHPIKILDSQVEESLKVFLLHYKNLTQINAETSDLCPSVMCTSKRDNENPFALSV